MPLSQSLAFYQQIETAANNAFAQAHWHGAVMHYQQAINLNQQDADLHYRLAQSLYALDNFDNAILACQQAIKLNAQFANAHKLLGDLLLKTQNYQNNPRVRWITQQNGGIDKASKAAIHLCRGVYIGQLDGDDILKPDAVETMVDYLDNHNVGSVYSRYEVIDTMGNYRQDGYNWPFFSREKLMGTMIVHHFRMFRKRDWLRTPGFNEQLKNAVDFDMFLKLSEVCTIHHLDQIMYAYRWHGENTSIVHKTAQFENHVQVIRLALERLGLDKDWEVYSPHQEDIRNVEFRKRNKVS